MKNEQRSRIMRAVGSKDTGPEWVVRRLLHASGYRYRLHRKDLPGKPDIVFARKRKLIFVHGCFWHGHDCARGARIPQSNREYWTAKITRNKTRDALHSASLTKAGWAVLTVWECEMRDRTALKRRLVAFLETDVDSEKLPASF